MSSCAVDDDATRFRILYLCTGNICRSVMAERLTRRELDARLGARAARFHVTSAGTRGMRDEPMHPHTADVLAGLDIDTDGFLARQLTTAMLREADLILTATNNERNHVVAKLPAALRRTFMMKEFARLTAHVDRESRRGSADLVERARRVVAEAVILRGQVHYVEPAEDDIADPARTPEAFRTCSTVIADAVKRGVDGLCGGAEHESGVHSCPPARYAKT